MNREYDLKKYSSKIDWERNRKKHNLKNVAKGRTRLMNIGTVSAAKQRTIPLQISFQDFISMSKDERKHCTTSNQRTIKVVDM